MGPTQFDHFAQGIAVRFSRRGVLHTLAGSALGGGLGLGALREAAALKSANSACSNGRQRASGVCIKSGKCKKNGRLTGKCRCGCTATDCPSGRTCRNGACFADCPTPSVCPTGEPEVCNQKKDCLCWTTDLGPSCTSNSDNNCDIGCTTSLDCPTGQVCMDIGPTCFQQCARKFCVNPCGLGGKDPETWRTSSSERIPNPQGGGTRVDLTDFGR